MYGPPVRSFRKASSGAVSVFAGADENSLPRKTAWAWTWGSRLPPKKETIGTCRSSSASTWSRARLGQRDPAATAERLPDQRMNQLMIGLLWIDEPPGERSGGAGSVTDAGPYWP